MDDKKILKKIDLRWQKYLDKVNLRTSTMPASNDMEAIDSVLTRGVKDIFPGMDELKKLLTSGKKLRIYTGIDPTADFLHVGHFIWMRKLAEFQRLGHQVIFLIGAFTAMIGDPDKKYTREPLTKEQVWKNFESYKDVASRILDFDNKDNPITILNNYDWLSQVTLEDWLQIMGSVTMQHLLSHEMFRTRLNDNLPIRLHEMMYPMMQGFDSVAMQVDLEVGGSDQTFNMLTGRILSRELINKEKHVMTLKLLTDAAGNKMGKTTGNAISSKDPAEEMFGKIMSWPDEVMELAFELLTDVDLEKVKSEMSPENNMRLKKELSYSIVAMVKGDTQAKFAQEYFEKTVQNKELPSEMPEILSIGEKTLMEYGKLFVEKGFLGSSGEFKRLVLQNAIEFDGTVINKLDQIINPSGGQVIKLGKRKFIRIK